MFVMFNPNPIGARAGDCVIRAICAVENIPWEKAYCALAAQGYLMKDMPSSNAVWGRYLSDNGYTKQIIPDNCPECYSVEKFAEKYNTGRYVIGTGTHAVAVIDGDVWDSWDSRNERPVYCYRKDG